MKILSRILLLFVIFFIAIGDVIFFIFSFFLSGIAFIWTIIISLSHVLASFLLRGNTHHQKIIHHRKITNTVSLLMKIRYFSIGVVFCFLLIGIPLGLITLFSLLPNPKNLQVTDLPQTTKIFDRNHKLLYAMYANQDRTIVPLAKIPIFLKEATIATEDKNFYHNPGFDLVAIFRAFVSDLTHKKFQGGSTITQQLVKSTLLTPEQSIQRKLEEIFLSFWTEHIYSKDQILELYLNEVPYGGTSWGVEAAANAYFGKDVKELDLAESAFLAGLPQAPTTYSPFGEHPNFWKRRQEEVLAHMQQLGFITLQEKEDARQEELHFIPPQTPFHAPHFSMYVKNLLIKKYGLPLVEKGGLNVVTTLDLSTQDMAQQVVTTEVAKDTYLQLSNGAVVVTNPQNGDILAMVGSADYNNPDWGNVNIATSLRQPGSSIKIVTYAAALTKGMTAATTIDDQPVSFPDGVNTYSPVNYDGKFHGRVTLRQALANSFNIPAVKTLNTIGVDAFITLGRQMGISSLLTNNDYGLSVTLGSPEVTMLDMATAYGTLANMGEKVDLYPILKVTDNNGNVLEEKKEIHKQQVLQSSVAFILNDILADNNARSWEFGTNSPLKIDNHFVSVKTGTTNSKRDNWTDGFTSNFVVIAWVGNNDNTPMSESLASGITGAAPIWHTIMSNLLNSKIDTQRNIPDTVIAKPCLGSNEYFVKGTENSANCTLSLPTWTPTPSPKL